MGNSLHNKIYLGRTSVFGSRRFNTVLLVGAFVGIGLAWAAVRVLR
jgi:hypothetical protein